jgi:hypothetical protein
VGSNALLTVPCGGQLVRWKLQLSQSETLCTPDCAPWRQVSEGKSQLSLGGRLRTPSYALWRQVSESDCGLSRM